MLRGASVLGGDLWEVKCEASDGPLASLAKHCFWEETAQSPVMEKRAGESLHRAAESLLSTVMELVFVPDEGRGDH